MFLVNHLFSAMCWNDSCLKSGMKSVLLSILSSRQNLSVVDHFRQNTDKSTHKKGKTLRCKQKRYTMDVERCLGTFWTRWTIITEVARLGDDGALQSIAKMCIILHNVIVGSMIMTTKKPWAIVHRLKFIKFMTVMKNMPSTIN